MLHTHEVTGSSPVVSTIIEDLCNGSTPDSDSVCGGSNPSSSAKKDHTHRVWSFFGRRAWDSKRPTERSEVKNMPVACCLGRGRIHNLPDASGTDVDGRLFRLQ